MRWHRSFTPLFKWSLILQSGIDRFPSTIVISYNLLNCDLYHDFLHEVVMPTSATLSKFHEGIRRLLTQPEVPDGLYYHLTLVRKPSGGFQWSVQTQWCGYTEERPKREIRKGALYLGEAQRALLHQFGQLALLVNEEKDIAYFYGFGGHALILKELGDRRFKSLVEPDVCWRDSGGLGFISESSLDSSRMQHAPSKKLRMGVLTRDGRRCLI